MRDSPIITVNGRAVSFVEVLVRLKVDGAYAALVEGAVRRALVLEAAEQRGLSLSDEELQRAVDSFRAERGLDRVEDTERWLAENGLTLEDLEGELEGRALEAKLVAGVASPAAVEKYFVEHRHDFDEALISRIVVDKREVAAELLSQVTDDGQDFGALARRHSLDRELGGWVRPRDLDETEEARVFTAAPGDVVGPFGTDEGWEIVRVEEVRRAVLDDGLRAEVSEILFREWLDARRREGRIVQ
ncbi:MAG: peptidylprolyl isomerase [Planctomycetes bacterium]|nr:peptidylprolyl isomerase [Planctomycetota bacterium]